MVKRELELGPPETVIEARVIIAIYSVRKRLKPLIQVDADHDCRCESNAARNSAHIEPAIILDDWFFFLLRFRPEVRSPLY